MAAPSEGFWQRRGALGLYELLLTWWRHRFELFLQAHELYRKRRWEDAQKSFQFILDTWARIRSIARLLEALPGISLR